MKAFLIPGSGEDLKSRDYAAVLKMYKSLGYEPHFVPIVWKYATADGWVRQVHEQISEHDLSSSILSGFSYGAMAAFTAAAKIANPKKLLLFSLSPYFAEDIPEMPEKYKIWAGKRRMANFERLSFDSLALQIKCPTLSFMGSEEIAKYPDMKRRFEATRKIPKAELMIVDSAKHDVSDPKYIAAIRQALK